MRDFLYFEAGTGAAAGAGGGVVAGAEVVAGVGTVDPASADFVVAGVASAGFFGGSCFTAP